MKGAFAVDVENVLGREYLKTDEKEVVLLPFQKIQIKFRKKYMKKYSV